jgi:hypothetical protein
LLAKIEGTDLREEISAQKGIGVYLFIDAHVDRMAYSMRSAWVHRSPYYVLTDNDEVVRMGNFHTSNPILYSLYHDILSKSALLKLLRVNFPIIGEGEISLTCRVIAKSKHQFEEQFPISSFYVIFYPKQKKYAPDLKRCFDEIGINYLDYSDEPWPEKYRIPFDGHPNASGHQYFAKLITPKLEAAMEQLVR